MWVDERTAVLSLEGVGFRFPRGRQVFDHVDLTLGTGQCIALLGANGSGKTTLLRMLAGLATPTSGAVRLDGTAVTGSRADRNRRRTSVQMVLQEPDDQIIGATVRADVSFGPTNLGLDSAEVTVRVEEAMTALGIADLAERIPHHLSFGQRKRVSIAGAIAMRPRILLLDEATSGLDPQAVDDLLVTLAGLVESGTTVVLATHDVDVAWSWAREVLVIDERRVRRGITHELLVDTELMAAARLGVPWGAPVSRALGRLVLRPEDV
ncbi:ABC transporter ATP-binding protein [Gordonia sp. PKS22-38]|uniref:ABC transporter ATP-binding protein n=1 Tax=Gordonia prachuapensis TaxID=3115651 RepID=A0ABU7MRU2_9ACTN|nr:ABC transporter ATP-binding protein [Gordonia sp. PKS22-38]